MKSLSVAIVLVAFASFLPRAFAGPVPVCCACIPVDRAQTAGTNNTAVTAFFCAAAISDTTDPLGARCEAISDDAKLLCRATLGNSSCTAEFAETGVICPGSPAPVASPLNLATLTVGLAALGALVLQRRRRASMIRMEDQP